MIVLCNIKYIFKYINVKTCIQSENMGFLYIARSFLLFPT